MNATPEVPPDILAQLYSTVTDRGQWQGFCDTLHSETSAGIMMFGHNIAQNESLGIIAGGIDPVQLEVYHEHFADQNPWMHMNLVMPTGMVGVSDQALAREDLFKTEFYNDWLRPQEDIVAGPAMICYRSADRFVAMAAACRARGVDDALPANTGILEALAPHMKHAVTMAQAFSETGQASFSHLETSRFGTILIRRSGRVAYVNTAAERFLACSKVLGVGIKDGLIVRSEGVNTFVRQAVDAISRDEISALPPSMTFQNEEFGLCMLHAHVFPAGADHKFPCNAWTDPVAGALVITGRFGFDGPEGYEGLAISLGATPAEARVAAGLLNGRTLYEIADETGVSRHTVRNQMRSLLEKTQSRNQTEFIRRMAGLLSPFDDRPG